MKVGGRGASLYLPAMAITRVLVNLASLVTG